MLVIGITGGIGSGKSTVSSYLKERGFAHIDADRIGHEVTADGSSLLEILRDEIAGCGQVISFDENVPGNGLVLNRRAVAQIVFNDIEKRRRFEKIVQGEIIGRIEERLDFHRKEGERAVLLDAPLIFEAGISHLCDYVILITADIDRRIERVVARDGITPEEVRSRIANQMSDEEKKKLADYIVDNSCSREETLGQVERIMAEIAK